MRHQVKPAVYAVLRRGDEVFLIRRANTGWMDGWYTLPSGHLETGETLATALSREVKEEIAVEAESISLVHVLHRFTRETEYLDFFFEITWRGNPVNAEPSKCDGTIWYSTSNHRIELLPHVKQALNCISKKEQYSEFRESA